jgi:hypothetical protein
VVSRDDEALDARLTEDHVALGTLEGVHWGDQVVAQGTHEVGVHVVGLCEETRGQLEQGVVDEWQGVGLYCVSLMLLLIHLFDFNL